MKKISLCAFADEAGDSLAEQIAAMKENGISYLEIRNVDKQNISDITADKAKAIKSKLSKNGLSVFSIGSPIGKIGIEDDFEPHLEKFKATLETADILGAKVFRLFSFYIDKEKNADDFTEKVLERMNKFVLAAKNSDVVLCHENEKGIFGDVPKRCEIIHKNIPQLKAVFDPANFVQCGVETLSAFDMLSPYIHYMHIKDSTADGTVVPSGKGIGNIAELLKKYQGEILTLEPHLYEFSGLKNLEQEGETSGILQIYNNNREAFDAGVNALKNILKGE